MDKNNYKNANKAYRENPISIFDDMLESTIEFAQDYLRYIILKLEKKQS